MTTQKAESKINLSVEGVSKEYPISLSGSRYLLRKIANKIRPTKEDKEHSHSALKDITFTLKRGDALGIIGKNGAGKSTLLQILSGTLAPSRGLIRRTGRVASILELGVGFHPDFSGTENSRMQLAMLGFTPEQASEKLDAIRTFADIGKFFDEPIRTYSSGMLVRLAFSIIANSEPDILIVDEALAVGDIQFVQKCLRFIQNFKGEGILILVSHDIATIRSYCDRVIWIDQGTAKLDGPPETVTDAFIEAFFETHNQSVREQGEASSERIDPESYSPHASTLKAINEPVVDVRSAARAQSNIRNDIEVCKFSYTKDGSFGAGGAEIIHAALLDSESLHHVNQIVGGELCIIEVHAACYETLDHPIIGFIVRNPSGLELFGDNTFISTQLNPVKGAKPGTTIKASFTFQFPPLPNGDYTITIAVANHTENGNIQHHWIHDAIALHSNRGDATAGLLGIPMKEISLSISEETIPQT